MTLGQSHITEAQKMKHLVTDGVFCKFLIDIDDDVEYSMNFRVYEVTSWEMDNTPSDVERYAHGTIKWDGCSHIWFGSQEDGSTDGYIHLCGKSSWQDHCKMMSALFDLASVTIKKYDKGVAE